MKIRKITSLTAFLSFTLTLLTSIVLYIVPQGRVAYWADWKLWGLSKEEWGAIHINLGFLFLVSLLLHIYYNWKPITSYMKNKAKELKVFTKDFNVALIITLLFTLGTYFDLPPFSTIIDISDSIKESAAKKYGEPPYGHAELSSLKTFTKKMGIDLKTGMTSLRKAGFKVKDENQTLKEIAHINGVSPQKLFIPMQGQAKNRGKNKKIKLPDSPVPGTGNMTLADFCHQYNLNMKIIVRSLGEHNIKAKEDMTLKKIAKANSTSPSDIFETIKTIVN